MILFPNCKVNLGLNITRKRADGFHDLETIFYPLALNDALEIIQSPNAAVEESYSSFPAIMQGPFKFDDVEFSSSGLNIQGDPSHNLCIRAYQLLKKDFPTLPPIKMHLHKTIPMGAGLGGGSSDGAFALKLLNQKFNLGLSNNVLQQYALQLGSDCPFFILNTPCIARGRGELLQPMSLDLSGWHFLLVHPSIHVSTSDAFSSIIPAEPAESIEQIIKLPPVQWKNSLKNDFEAPVFKRFPELAAIKQSLYDHGASYASMSGSGSSLYGIFSSKPTAAAEALGKKYTVSVL